MEISRNRDEWLWEQIGNSEEMIGIELLIAHKEFYRSYSWISQFFTMIFNLCDVCDARVWCTNKIYLIGWVVSIGKYYVKNMLCTLQFI